MTMTPTKQTPSECKHNYGLYCTLPKNQKCECIVKHFMYCPDYEPKEKKDNE